MGRVSRERRERRNGDVAGDLEKRLDRIRELQEELKRLADGDAVFSYSKLCPPEDLVTDLEDILAFESVGTGTSLFDGLQEHGLDLPHPEKLDEEQSALKAGEVFEALARMRIFLIGFDHMSARELYSTLWHQTLWEACYVEKRNQGAFTIVDVSHSLPRSEVLKYLESMRMPDFVH